MEAITIFISIIFIVFGILQIILFFKVWDMTNNVAKMLSEVRIISGTARKEIAAAIAETEKNIAELENFPERPRKKQLLLYFYKEHLASLQSKMAEISD